MQRTLLDLHAELRECQRRLGTAAECPADFERALLLAHEINNHLAVAYMQATALTLHGPTPSLAAVCRQCLVTPAPR